MLSKLGKFSFFVTDGKCLRDAFLTPTCNRKPTYVTYVSERVMIWSDEAIDSHQNLGRNRLEIFQCWVININIVAYFLGYNS